MGTHRSDLRGIARRAMVERDFYPDFSPAALGELARISVPADGTGDPQVRNLIHWQWVSIDNDDSRDLDQLTVAEVAPDGLASIRVAIADVDALVAKDSSLDAHALHNTTSVYTSGGVFPMLPDKLSTDLTSLNERQDRLAIVVDMRVAEDGEVLDSRIYRAMVRNHAKLAYGSVGAWLEGTGPVPDAVKAVEGLDAQLRLQDRVARRLKARRHQEGALSLETLEPKAVFDGERLSTVLVERKNRAKDLIEDFMIAANQASVSFLKAEGLPSFRRVLRSPERWQRIAEVAARWNEALPAEPDARALEAFLVKRREADPLRFPDLSLAIVKLIGRGEYVLDRWQDGSSEHFGLAVRDYTHSTAPNRRFPDLITQRLIKAALANASLPYRPDELQFLADHCTRKEDDAEKVERQLRKSAAALLLESQIGRRFDAIVTGASNKGTWVRLLDPPVEGKLISHAGGLDVGDILPVELLHTDVEHGFIDFAPVGPAHNSNRSSH
ncbi:putative exoribonuclease II [Nitrospira japonica]|uniref:Putative exoribonuclease II n=1 Tax=Nitrospira japonica TaxID=1325564 RepID=A0A1W1IAE6_9BACT|nr:RNB domain-containing ribonuclease [Nitrospira japonica]SLM49891.1 putative exoribonuclease II [Nitrospira japonica]